MIWSPHLSLALLLLALDCSYSVSLIKSHKSPQKNNHQNISTLLDNLLYGYDNSIRPDFGGPAAVIEVDIMVRSMGPISEVDMTYSMDCYFRQSWVDRRLAFSVGHENDTLALSIKMLQKIWKPDTYFYNGKQSYLHTITTPNKFVRLFHDGRVLYSSRLTIKAGCPMNLEDFPMDIQRCPLKFGSFGYTTTDVIYRWNSARQIAIAEDMKLSQFDLIATPAGNQTDSLFGRYLKTDEANLDQIAHQTMLSSSSQVGWLKSRHDAEYSMLLVSFHLRRHMGNFLIQVYGPCVLLVVLSWVSFWLNREATADRVSLGITTVLTMTFLGLEARTDLPKVAYPTALDFFVFLAFVFIFATIIQFAIVHYFTKYGSGECYFGSDFSSDESGSSDDEWETIREKEILTKKSTPKRVPQGVPYLEIIPLSGYSVPPFHKIRKASAAQCSWVNWSRCFRKKEEKNQQTIVPENIQHCSEHRLSIASQTCVKRKKKKRTPRFNSVSKIDRASRIGFPVLFITINIFYWYFYLSRTSRLKNTNVL